MPYCKISRDLKLAAVNLFEHNLLTIRQIVDCVGFSERIFWRITKLWRETGDVVRHNTGLPGRPRSLHFEDVSYLLRLVNHRPNWFLDELLGMC
jgi:transposase